MVEQPDGLTRQEEAALVEAAKRDPHAFGRLYELNVQKVFSYLYYRTGNHHDAEDLTARVFFKALRHIGRYQERGLPFTAWLYRIAHNAVVNWMRDSRAGSTVGLEELAAFPAPGANPIHEAVRGEEQQRLMQAIRSLSEDRQQLLILKFVERCSNQEIGELLGRSEGAIKSLYHRTLLALRKELGVELEEENA